MRIYLLRSSTSFFDTDGVGESRQLLVPLSGSSRTKPSLDFGRGYAIDVHRRNGRAAWQHALALNSARLCDIRRCCSNSQSETHSRMPI